MSLGGGLGKKQHLQKKKAKNDLKRILTAFLDTGFYFCQIIPLDIISKKWSSTNIYRSPFELSTQIQSENRQKVFGHVNVIVT